MKNIIVTICLITLGACSDFEEGDFSREMSVEILYNDSARNPYYCYGEPGFYVVESDLEFREIFNLNPPAFDFTSRMMLIFVSEKNSGSDAYEVGKLIEREQDINFHINYVPCDYCTKDAVSKVLIVGTSRSTKPIVLDLTTN